MELCFLRDNNQREIDFVVIYDNRLFFYQAHMGKDDYEIRDLRARVMPFTQFVAEILKV